MMITFEINKQKIDGDKAVGDWIANGLTDIAIKYAEHFGKELTAPTVKGRDGLFNNRGEALTTSQIRNVYGEVVKMRMKDSFAEVKNPLLLLKPRLAYSTERKGTEGSKDFRKVFDQAVDAVLAGSDDDDKFKRFQNFANFFEAVLAYHRAFGGK
ncbi:MAG: type III-A CRISPR-associated protein Csm2 [Saprospiraceae bacterium]|nr:type III-A CRISPR-associated protein Csm2 [Saprospiraceae bacterium]